MHAIKTHQQPKKQSAGRRLVDGMPYVPSVATDIRSTFARHGFVGPQARREQAQDNALTLDFTQERAA